MDESPSGAFGLTGGVRRSSQIRMRAWAWCEALNAARMLCKVLDECPAARPEARSGYGVRFVSPFFCFQKPLV